MPLQSTLVNSLSRLHPLRKISSYSNAINKLTMILFPAHSTGDQNPRTTPGFWLTLRYNVRILLDAIDTAVALLLPGQVPIGGYRLADAGRIVRGYIATVPIPAGRAPQPGDTDDDGGDGDDGRHNPEQRSDEGLNLVKRRCVGER